MNTLDIASNLFSGIIKDDIVNFFQENYSKVNKKEVREDLDLSNRSIASNFSDKNWSTLKKYVKDKNLGNVVEIRGKRRWQVDGLNITMNKVDEKLRTANPYIDDSEQMKMDLGLPTIDVSIEHPIVIGYIPDNNRLFIKEIHVIKYNMDGSLQWNIPLFNINCAQQEDKQYKHRDIKSIMKIKKPANVVVSLFDE